SAGGPEVKRPLPPRQRRREVGGPGQHFPRPRRRPPSPPGLLPPRRGVPNDRLLGLLPRTTSRDQLPAVTGKTQIRYCRGVTPAEAGKTPTEPRRGPGAAEPGDRARWEKPLRRPVAGSLARRGLSRRVPGDAEGGEHQPQA